MMRSIPGQFKLIYYIIKTYDVSCIANGIDRELLVIMILPSFSKNLLKFLARFCNIISRRRDWVR